MKFLAAGLILFLATGSGSNEGDSVESLRYNPRERTLSGISALEKGDVETAVEHLESAHRLDQASPLTAFNAGTARLIAGADDAAARLEEAAALAPDHLQPAALYNLGNARLAEQNPEAAIDAFKQTLRLDSDHMEAKFNLEVAQRLLQQQQEQQQQEDQEQQEKEQNQDSSEEEQDQQQGEEPQEEPDEQPGEEPDEQKGPGSEDEQQEQDRPLPDFENQGDMTAEQAAAILEAVENLEREQRRQQAAERARRRAKSGKDW